MDKAISSFMIAVLLVFISCGESSEDKRRRETDSAITAFHYSDSMERAEARGESVDRATFSFDGIWSDDGTIFHFSGDSVQMSTTASSHKVWCAYLLDRSISPMPFDVILAEGPDKGDTLFLPR
jgi:hypothetical protein